MTDTSDTAQTPEPAQPEDSQEKAQDAPDMAEPVYHLYLDREEASTASSALRLLIADEAHEPDIRAIARKVLEKAAEEPGENGVLIVELTPPEMKITHTAVKLLHDDLQRGQADERHVLARILDKLPDEHAIRAITIE